MDRFQVLSLAFGAFFRSNWWSIRKIKWDFRDSCSGIVSAVGTEYVCAGGRAMCYNRYQASP